MTTKLEKLGKKTTEQDKYLQYWTKIFALILRKTCFISFWQEYLLYQIFALAVLTLLQFVTNTINVSVSWVGPNFSEIFAKIKGVPFVVFYFTLSLHGEESAEQSFSSVWKGLAGESAFVDRPGEAEF